MRSIWVQHPTLDFIIYAPWVHHKQAVGKTQLFEGQLGLLEVRFEASHESNCRWHNSYWFIMAPHDSPPFGGCAIYTFTTMYPSCQLKLQPHRACKFELRQHMPATASLKAFLFRQPVVLWPRHRMIPSTASHHFGLTSKGSCAACLMKMKILGVC